MQISIEKTEGLERNLNVSIPAEDIQSKVSDKLKEIGKQVKIKGFRPGKVPKNILISRYGKHARQEVLGDLMNTTIQDAVKENELNIAETPEITTAKDLEDGGYSFTAKLEVMPEIPAIDFTSIEVKTKKSEVKEADVKNMIKKLRKQKQEWKDSKAKIAKGDLVTIEYKAKDGKTTVHPESGKEKMGILLGESGVPDELVDAIIGKNVKDSDSVKVDFPKQFNVKELADKKLTVKFDILDHKKGKLPKVDEEFVKSFGVDSGKEEDLLKEIKENLKRELSNTLDAKNKASILDAIRANIKDVQISEKMLNRECGTLAQQAMQQAQQQGVENPQQPELRQFEKMAKERIINSLIISKVSKDEDIKVDFMKVREKVIESAQTFENPEQIVEYYYKTPELMASIEGSVLETQVINWISTQVQAKEKEVSFDKVMGNTL
ncbi:MAG: trigger factor [Marinicellaceae bacterium]